jgi:hypothetical protein
VVAERNNMLISGTWVDPNSVEFIEKIPCLLFDENKSRIRTKSGGEITINMTVEDACKILHLIIE